MDRRVRTGCATCRRRRVKCDEAKPVCARCRAANFLCEGYTPPRRTSDLSAVSGSPPRLAAPREGSPFGELSWRHRDWRKEQLPLYHHFVTTSVVRLFRIDHVSFWRDQVAQMSYGLDIVYEALLAIGAVHRSSLLACQDGNFQESARFRVLGLHAYGNVLRLLPSQLLQQNTEAERFAVLVVLMLLTYFECFLENPKGALRHLWAAIQLLRGSEDRLTNEELSNMVPVYDAMLRLDFLAQKLVPYARSSFLRCSDLAIMEVPFWNRPSPLFSGTDHADRIAAERYCLIQLIAAHNTLSRVVWGCWCPTSERPSQDELLGFYAEMMLWKKNSPATFAGCAGVVGIEALDFTALESLPIPPAPCSFSSNEAALNVAMYNGYLGCTVAMLSTTDPDPTVRELEAFNLVYQNLCIAAELIDRHDPRSGSPYKPCDSISLGISVPLVHGVRRCYSQAWQNWTITALRTIGREGLSNGLTSANMLEIGSQLEARMLAGRLNNAGTESYIGPIRDRLIPILMPRGEDDQLLAFYLRYGNAEVDGDEESIQIVARASWRQDLAGSMISSKVDVYESAIAGDIGLPERPEALELFFPWRQAVEKGWHGYLATGIQDRFLRSQGLLTG